MNFDPTSPTSVAMIGGIIRTILSAVGGGGLLSGDQTGQIAGALAILVTVVWSLYQKHHVAATTVTHETLTTSVNAAASTPEAAGDIIKAAKAGQL